MRTSLRAIASLASIFAIMIWCVSASAQTQQQLDEIKSIEDKIEANQNNPSFDLQEAERYLMQKKIEFGMIGKSEAMQQTGGTATIDLSNVVLVYPTSVGPAQDPYEMDMNVLIQLYKDEIQALEQIRANSHGEEVTRLTVLIDNYKLMIMKAEELAGNN